MFLPIEKKPTSSLSRLSLILTIHVTDTIQLGHTVPAIFSVKCICFISDLQVPVLVYHPLTMELVVNFEPYLFEIMKEADHMIKLNLDVPQTAKLLLVRGDYLRSHVSELQVSLIFIFDDYLIKCQSQHEKYIVTVSFSFFSILHISYYLTYLPSLLFFDTHYQMYFSCWGVKDL